MAVGQIIAKALGSITRKMERAGGRNLTRLSLLARSVSGRSRPANLGPLGGAAGGSLKQAEPESWMRKLVERLGGSSNAGQAGRDTPGWAARFAGAIKNQRMVVDHRDSAGSPGAPEKLSGGLLGQIATAVGAGRTAASGAARGGPGAAGATGGQPRSTRTPGGVAAGAVGQIGMSAGLGAAAVALGMSNPITAAATVAAGALMTLTVAGNSLADSLLESQKGLASFNSTIAVAYMKLQNAEMRRSFESAGRRAGALEDLAEQSNKFDQSTQELKDLAAILGMQMGGWVKGALTRMAEGIKELPGIRAAIDDMNKNAKKYAGNPSLDFINAFAGERREAQRPKANLPGGK